MAETNVTQEAIDEVMTAYEDGEDAGVCYECSHVQLGGVEPDAERYECENCHELGVRGVEIAVMECGLPSWNEV